MKNIINTCIVLITIFGAVSISNAQSEKMKKKPASSPQPVEAPKKVIEREDEHTTTVTVTKQNEVVYTEVDEQPQFKGGNEALYKWIGNNIKYPEAARKKKKEGVVVAQFIIEKDGKVSTATIQKDEVGFGADQEVLQLLDKMPYWSPGKINDQPVRVMYSIPVSFKL